MFLARSVSHRSDRWAMHPAMMSELPAAVCALLKALGSLWPSTFAFVVRVARCVKGMLPDLTLCVSVSPLLLDSGIHCS